MELSTPQIIDFTLLLLGLFGFLVCFYIYSKKIAKKKLICPMRASCDTVLHSTHSNFLGFSLERIGLIYYGLVIAIHVVSFVSPNIFGEFIIFISIFSSAFAALFSFYLLSVQAFVLRKWCSWCLMSASASIAIFIGVFFFPLYDLKIIFADLKHIITILHLFGVVIGLGAATISDILFFKFLKDYKISEEENETLTTLSQTIWFALGLLIITGIALYIPSSERLVDSGKFLAKMSAVGVLMVNGFLLNILVAPSLVRMSFVENDPHEKDEFKKLRNSSFIFGAISIVSWYFVFVLGALRGKTFDYWNLILIYVSLLLFAIILSSFMGKRMILGKSPTSQNN